MSQFNSQGFSIGFEKIEGAGAHNVFFIHGNLASKEWWYPTMELMKGKPGDGKVIAADWRGYGDSTGLTEQGQIDFRQFAQDFVNLIEAEGMQDVHVVGHSTGGLIAMLAVLNKPELFKSLLLLDSVGVTGLELQLPKEQVLAHFEKMSTDRDYCFATLAATINDVNPQSSVFQKLFEITWACDKVMYKGVIDVLSDQIDITEEVGSINQPTLILHGDKDMVLPLAMSEHTDQVLPNSTLKVLDGQGHSTNMENPQRLFEVATSFWDTL